jgi:hypothetical protein
MREKLGILLMEKEDGDVSVQLFADPDKVVESVRQLSGKPADDPSRATLISIDYLSGKVSTRVKDLPVEQPDKEEEPDGRVLGEGPVWFEKEGKDDGEDSSGD